MKKKMLIVLGGLFCIGILTTLTLWPRQDVKADILAYVQENYVELNDFAENIVQAGSSMQTTFNGWKVTYFPGSGMLQFDVHGTGFGSSTTYEGFYYSQENVPKGFQGAKIEYQLDGTMWRWQEPEGDNFVCTEQIIGKWYWFKMYF